MLRESAVERTNRYLATTSVSLRRLKLKGLPATVSKPRVDYVLNLVRGYVEDAKHYARKRKSVTSLACIAYAEGLLDALKFLDLAEI